MTEQQLRDTCEKGTYYYNAASRYPSGKVICDSCQKSNLDSCIGYNEFDLCLSCAQTIRSSIRDTTDTPKFTTKMMQSQFSTNRVTPTKFTTRMMQSQFVAKPELPSTTTTTDSKPTTKMMQTQFRNSRVMTTTDDLPDRVPDTTSGEISKDINLSS